MPEEDEKTFGQKMSDCGSFCYNSEKGEVLGRTGKSWALIILFYLVYYGALAGFFAICLTGFFATLEDRSPTQKNMQSLLKQNPGMGFRPVIDVTSTTIKFNSKDPKSYEAYVKNLNETLSIYMKSAGDSYINCVGPDAGKSSESINCNFPLTLLGDQCTAEKKFGYAEGKPCVLLKMNKVYGWNPEPYNNDTEHDLPQSLNGRLDPEYVGVTCQGEVDADLDIIKNITYTPDKGFPTAFYPYTNQIGYLPPVVMAQFDVIPGRLLMVWCKVWAKNIKHHRGDLQGSVHFELLVDNKEV